MLASFEQVTRELLEHEVPMPEPQPAGGAGHVQTAPGNAPAHGLPTGHVDVTAW
jgi:hypothetical protein